MNVISNQQRKEFTMTDKYTVRHFWPNPRNNEELNGLNKSDAIAEAKKMTSDDRGASSSIYRNGVLVADRDWTKKNLSWVK